MNFTSTEKVNGASYCRGPDFESLPETGHCDCGFLQHLKQNVFSLLHQTNDRLVNFTFFALWRRSNTNS